MSNQQTNRMTLFDESFDVDEQSMRRTRGDAEAVIADDNLKLRLRDNRVVLSKCETSREDTNSNETYYAVPFLLDLQAHPECRFKWARLIIDFTVTNGAQICDMSPQEVRGNPVKLTTSKGVGVKLEVAPVLAPEAKVGQTRESTVYFPEITSSGLLTKKAIWNFTAPGDEYLHTNTALYLKIRARPDNALQAKFSARAQVMIAGMFGLFPLFRRTADVVDKVYILS